jgi:predicted GNAT family N-acyltransferase
MNNVINILPTTSDLALLLAGETSLCFNVNKQTAYTSILNYPLVALLTKAGSQEILSFCTLNEISLPSTSIIEIWNVCTPAATRKKGYTSELVSKIIEYSKQQKAKLWLCIDDEKNIKLYTKLGFINPSVVSTSITGTSIGRLTVELVYDENAFSDEITDAQAISKELLVFIASRAPNKRTTIVEISKNALEQVYKSKSNWLINEDAEYGGELYYDGSVFNFRNIEKGSTTAVTVPCYPFSFHTHPLVAYQAVSIGLNPISDTDLVREFYCMSQLHIVFAMEGLYVFQLTPEIHSFLKLLKLYSNEADNFIECFKEEVSRHVNSVITVYRELAKLLKDMTKKKNDRASLYEKALSSRAPRKTAKMFQDRLFSTELDIINSPVYRTKSRPHIQTIIDGYNSITLKQILKHDKTKKLKGFCKKFFKSDYEEIQIFYINFIENILEKLAKNAPVYIEYV